VVKAKEVRLDARATERLQTECRFFTPEGWKKRGQGQHLVDYFDGPDEIWQHLPEKVLDDILDEELATNESSDDTPTKKQ
ncbi:hypothetical protein L916_06709, partial [Phytophthora nicotianae]